MNKIIQPIDREKKRCPHCNKIFSVTEKEKVMQGGSNNGAITLIFFLVILFILTILSRSDVNKNPQELPVEENLETQSP